jgi:putative tricarboxylic transport membrane protein|tara:strand:+ start:2644 stop:4122 length:1479 start_codon:yes stop_codon:yes gene_type:complete
MEFHWENIFSPLGLISAFLGASLGIIWGCLPGLSATMAMALLVGLTYNMPVEVAVIFMMAVYTGVEFGGAISAILVNIPGTPAAVPTQLAGHPLAQRGQGGQAIGTALLFSFLGNWIGILALILTVPFMISVALRFSSWEMFLLALLGVAISGTLTSKEEPIKGWAMGCIGLLIATIGKEGVYGVERFTFDIGELSSGIRFIPVLIGLFGLTEVFNVLSRSSGYVLPSQVGGILPSFSLIRDYWKSGIRSGLIGTLIGAVPGAGANIASFVSYTVGEQVTGKKFSKGDLEGVVCSEVANNANIGGGLLPTLTLGIPGNNSCALFLAALSLHGIIVGPNIEINQPGFMYFLYTALLVANFFMYLSAFSLIKPSVFMFSLPTYFVMPVIAVLCLIGTYATNYSNFDLFIMFFSGLIGYGLVKLGYPFAPLVLGMILGPLADENLRRTLLIHEGNYEELLLRPIGLILIVAVVWSFYFGIKRSRLETKRLKSEED